MGLQGDTALFERTVQVDYSQALTLVGLVIALHATAIARERSRPRPDREWIATLEQHRRDAVDTCRRLSSNDPDELFRVVQEYSAVHDTLLAMTRHA
ncbi:MAG TPA: hypothetical protein VE081_06955 [Sporichthyaceae bacterium]|nr:hypothetical protein [Sporichthyaceae bacterium]